MGREAALPVAAAVALSWFLGATALRTLPGTFASVWNTATRAVTCRAMRLPVARLRHDRARLARANARLRGAFERERQLWRTDPLTGLSNLRRFLEELAREAGRGRLSLAP